MLRSAFQPPARPSAARAAMAVWIAAGALVLTSGCAAGLLGTFAALPDNLLRQSPEVQRLSVEERRALDVLHVAAPWLAAGTLVIFTLPAAALGALGFGVNAGHPRAVRWAIRLCTVLCLVLGVWLLVIMAGGPGALFAAAVNAAVIALLWWARVRLLNSLDVGVVTPGPTHPRDPADDPWDARL